MENVRALFAQYKAQSVLFYILAQVMQIVICVIPGQWLQFTAGYMWGFWLGYLYSLIGALIGSVLTYYIARILGHDAMHLIFGEEKIKKWLVHLNSKKAVIIVFFIFLIPGVPKDLCNYVAGLSEINAETVPHSIADRAFPWYDGKPSDRSPDRDGRIRQRRDYRRCRSRVVRSLRNIPQTVHRIAE